MVAPRVAKRAKKAMARQNAASRSNRIDRIEFQDSNSPERVSGVKVEDAGGIARVSIRVLIPSGEFERTNGIREIERKKNEAIERTSVERDRSSMYLTVRGSGTRLDRRSDISLK